MLVPGRTMAVMPSSIDANRPAPCAASTADPVEGASAEAGILTGSPPCRHGSASTAAIPVAPAHRDFGRGAAARPECIQDRAGCQNRCPSMMARKMCLAHAPASGRRWRPGQRVGIGACGCLKMVLHDQPVAARLAPRPGGSSRPGPACRRSTRRSQLMIEPVEVCPPSTIQRPG